MFGDSCSIVFTIFNTFIVALFFIIAFFNFLLFSLASSPGSLFFLDLLLAHCLELSWIKSWVVFSSHQGLLCLLTLLHLLAAFLLLLLVQLVLGQGLDIEVPLTLWPLSYSGGFGLVGGNLELHERAQPAHQPVFDESGQDDLQLACLWVHLLS